MPIPAGYQETIVTPETSRSIEAYWSYVATARGESIILPDGRCDVIFRYNFGSADAPVPIITGPATLPYSVTFKPDDAWVGVRLRPGNGRLLWQQDLVHAENKVLRGQEVYKRLPALVGLSATIPSVRGITSALCAIPALDETEKSSAMAVRALEIIHLSGGRIRVAALATLMNRTTRQLNRSFRSEIGLCAKDYARLVQFHRALGLVQRERFSLVDSAFEAGYADQAHLTRSFQRFGGFSPARIPRNLSLPGILT